MNTAMVKAGAEDITPFQPDNLQQAWQLSEWLSQAQLLPQQFRGKPADCFAALLLGRDLGISPMQALLNIDVIDGKPRLNALMTVALVKSSPLCKFFRLVETDDTHAVYETWRVGNPSPTPMAYTIEDARRARLVTKQNWQTDPAGMLRRRASMRLAREEYPDVVGNVYDQDEIEEFRERAAQAERSAPPPVVMAPPRPMQPPPSSASRGAAPGPALQTPAAKKVIAEVEAQQKKERAEDEAAIEAVGRAGSPAAAAQQVEQLRESIAEKAAAETDKPEAPWVEDEAPKAVDRICAKMLRAQNMADLDAAAAELAAARKRGEVSEEDRAFAAGEYRRKRAALQGAQA